MKKIAWFALLGGGLLWSFVSCSSAPPSSDPPTAPIEASLVDIDEAAAQQIRELLQTAQDNPDDGAARGRLGMAYEMSALHQAALDSYEQARQMEPDEARWSYFAAQTEAQLGNLDRALLAVEEAIEENPMYLSARLYRANWLIDLGRDAEAAAEFERVLEREPASPAAIIGLARALLNLDQPERAVSLIEDLRSAGGRHPLIDQLLARGYRQTGDLERAADLLARPQARTSAPGWPDPWNDEKEAFKAGFGAELLEAGKLMARGDYPAAVIMLDALHAERPGDVTVLNNLTVALVRTGQLERAHGLLLKAVEDYPDNFPFRLNLAESYINRNDYDAALVQLDRAIELNPTLSHAHQQRGNLMIKLRRLPEAKESLGRAIQYEASDPQLFFRAAVIAFETQDYEQARLWAQRALELDPTLGNAYLVVASADLAEGDLEAANRALDSAEGSGANAGQIRALRQQLQQKGGA